MEILWPAAVAVPLPKEIKTTDKATTTTVAMAAPPYINHFLCFV